MTRVGVALSCALSFAALGCAPSIESGVLACEADTECPGDDAYCIGARCYRPAELPGRLSPCEVDDDCVVGFECLDRLCVVERGAECSRDSDCPPGGICESSLCLPPCHLLFDCPAELFCDYDTGCYVEACWDDLQCPFGPCDPIQHVCERPCAVTCAGICLADVCAPLTPMLSCPPFPATDSCQFPAEPDDFSTDLTSWCCGAFGDTRATMLDGTDGSAGLFLGPLGDTSGFVFGRRLVFDPAVAALDLRIEHRYEIDGAPVVAMGVKVRSPDGSEASFLIAAASELSISALGWELEEFVRVSPPTPVEDGNIRTTTFELAELAELAMPMGGIQSIEVLELSFGSGSIRHEYLRVVPSP